jgi:acyl-CoA thioester hydrolase
MRHGRKTVHRTIEHRELTTTAMPPIHHSTFPVRFYECDAYGHLNNAVYLRYMQEAAFNASASLGYDAQRYAQLGRAWLARLSEIRYLQPVRYGDSVVVATYVKDFQRVRSLRAYEMRLQGSQELVASGWTDWVFVDTQDNRPVSIPKEISAVYLPEGNQEKVSTNRHFPGHPEPPPGVYCHRRRVEWQDLDPAGHVNNAVYLSYLVEAAWGFGDVVGWTWELMSGTGIGVWARQHQIEYLLPAYYGDELEISTWLSGVRRATINRHYSIHRVEDGQLLARANSIYVCVDLSTGSPQRIPPDFLEAARLYISDLPNNSG